MARTEPQAGVASLAPPFPAVVFSLWIIAVLRLFYGTGTGDRDVFMMAAGVVHGAHSGSVINVLCYGPDLQFLFYYVFRLATALGLDDAGRVLLGINVMGAACCLAIPILLAEIWSRLSGDAERSRLAGLLLMTSPVYLMLTSCGHVLHLALTISLCAWLAFLAPTGDRGMRRRGLRLALAVSLQTLALTVRVEQVALFAVAGATLYALSPGRRRAAWGEALTFLVVPALLFLALRAALVPHPAAGSPGAASSPAASLLLRGLDPARCGWGAAHFLVEAGALLLLLALWCGVRGIDGKRWRLIGCAGGAILPTLAFYAGNPCPPRHFAIAVIGLTHLVAFGMSGRGLRAARGLIPLLLFVNLLAPWALLPFGRHAGTGRSALTYNALERNERNRTQIRAVHRVFAQLSATGAHRPVGVFGNWVQVSQICAEMADRPAMTVRRLSLPGGARPFVLSGPRFTFYLTEACDSSTVMRVSTELRRRAPGIVFLSLAESATGLNDFGIQVPSAALSWSD